MLRGVVFLNNVNTSFKHALHSRCIVPGLFERVADSLLCCARLYCISLKPYLTERDWKRNTLPIDYHSFARAYDVIIIDRLAC